MTNLEIIENNKLIADFMGLSYCEKYNYEGWYKNSEHNHRLCDFDGLKYHSSWNWLMPVVEKIMDLCRTQTTFICHRFFVGVSSINIKIEGQHRDFSNIDYFFTDSESRMIAIYSAAVDFIKWYNQ